MVKIIDIRKKTPRTNGTRPESWIKNIARHHSGSETGSWETFWPYWHNTKGWGTGGYHEIILRDGSVQLCYDPTEITNGVGGQNSYIYNICLVGNGSFTEAQERTFEERVHYWLKRFGLPVSAVKGHREFPGQSTGCPGINMNTVRARLAGQPVHASKPAAGGAWDERYGNTGPRVTQLQKDLNALGYKVTADGSYGPAVRDAVTKFQKDHKLTADGVYGPASQVAMSQALAAKKLAASAAWDVRYAETGKRVGEVQRILKDLGYYTGAIDNSFGPAMLEAVKAFQRDHKLAQDGIFGPSCQEAARKAQAAKKPMYRVYKDGKQTGAFREGDNALEAARKAINAGAKNIRIEEIKV